MNHKSLILIIWFALNIVALPAFAQLQTCPVNINFSEGDLSLWSATTGLINGPSINYPAPNTGVTTIPEYTLTNTAIQVITSSTTDPFGGFPTIPTINGYTYSYAVKIGSTTTDWELHPTTSNPGGFRRSITYTINVPAGPANVPYTMTYAYALVLENGTHNSQDQPKFTATLTTSNGVISCASPEYYLPTLDNAGANGTGDLSSFATGATLDTAAALAEGFSLSTLPFLSHAGQGGNTGTLLYDVWTKNWTEVTFDLAPYRGQQVILTFEADNCVPGAHFAYAYVALRNNCAGLAISGNVAACSNSTATYSVPALQTATYNWTVPPGWTITKGANTNAIEVTAGNTGGYIIAHEVNSCADLTDSMIVTATPPTVAGQVTSNNTVCAGTNNTQLTLSGQKGNILNWISSPDGVNWTPIPDTVNSYTAQNLTTTTQYTAVVQNGNSCALDTSARAIVTVDPQTVGGIVTPANSNICLNQNQNNTLILNNHIGSVLNWQQSSDSINWNNFAPPLTDSAYNANGVNTTTYLRAIVQDGVCPEDTSAAAKINFINTAFPTAAINPASSSICYGDSIQLNAKITGGTSYAWNTLNDLTTTQPSGTLTSLPTQINAIAKPTDTTDYVLSVSNAGCPNQLLDTFNVMVSPKIIVFAGNDTDIVAGQPVQLNASSNDPAANAFTWSPPTGLNFTNIYDPVATLTDETGDTVTYTVTATDAAGCSGVGQVSIVVFKTGPEIFIPTAFTPNGDGVNDMLTPVCVGIKQLLFFRVYNRWGQIIFNTNEIGKGWDGRFNGSSQPLGGYVYLAEGIDYTGKLVFTKGNVILLR